jgi:hypothetical protein
MAWWSAEKVWVPFIGLKREEGGRAMMASGANWRHKLSEGEEGKTKRKSLGCEGDKALVGSPSSEGRTERWAGRGAERWRRATASAVGDGLGVTGGRGWIRGGLGQSGPCRPHGQVGWQGCLGLMETGLGREKWKRKRSLRWLGRIDFQAKRISSLLGRSCSNWSGPQIEIWLVFRIRIK